MARTPRSPDPGADTCGCVIRAGFSPATVQKCSPLQTRTDRLCQSSGGAVFGSRGTRALPDVRARCGQVLTQDDASVRAFETPACRRSDHCFGAHARTWLTAPPWVDVQPMCGAREHAGRRRRRRRRGVCRVAKAARKGRHKELPVRVGPETGGGGRARAATLLPAWLQVVADAVVPVDRDHPAGLPLHPGDRAARKGRRLHGLRRPAAAHERQALHQGRAGAGMEGHTRRRKGRHARDFRAQGSAHSRRRARRSSSSTRSSSGRSRSATTSAAPSSRKRGPCTTSWTSSSASRAVARR